MAPLLNSLVTANARVKIIIGATIFTLITLIITFRPSFESTPWQPTQGKDAEPIQIDTTVFGPTTTLASASNATPVPTPSESSDPKEADKSETKAQDADKPESTKPNEGFDPCKDFPDTSDILLVLKTGATEAYDKLPIHFMTTLRCIKDYILFSDMEMRMAEHHLIDTLDEISADAKKDNGDFQLYEMLKEYHRMYQDPRDLKQGGNGWNLDKYKFLPMLLKTWKYRKDAKWYVFIEADTAVNWPNMRTFLDKLKPDKPYYIGSPTYLDIEFAHGGTGYIISQEAMSRGVGKHPDISKKYDKDVHGLCCGDRMIGKVMLDERIKLTRAWPMLNGEKPLTLPYGGNQWCQPVLTMHHATAQEVSQVWNFEQLRRAQGNMDPILWMDVYNHFVHNSLIPHRDDWSNLSNDNNRAGKTFTPDPSLDFNGRKWNELSEVERGSPESPDNCKKLCMTDKECFQWEHHSNRCRIGYHITMGSHKEPEKNKKFTSGWMFERIGAFRQNMKNCTDGSDWTFHEADRAWLD